jgi:hypothetical protein
MALPPAPLSDHPDRRELGRVEAALAMLRQKVPPSEESAENPQARVSQNGGSNPRVDAIQHSEWWIVRPGAFLPML